MNVTSRPLKILVVDDEMPARRRIRELLADLSGRVALEVVGEAANGRQALELAGMQQPDVVLLDIRMPKVDGVEVLRRLKSDPDLKKLPIIMLPPTDDIREVERCYALGCNEYIQKPVDYEKFAEAIRRLGLFVTLLLIPPVRPK